METPKTKIAVTLYNLREHCKTAEDLDATLAKVREIGYEAIQISGIGPIEPEIVEELLEKHKLYCCATHESLPNLLENFDAIVRKMKLWNCDFTALGHPGNDYWSENGIAELAGILDDTAQQFEAEGLMFGYHNHHTEFAKCATGKIYLEEIYHRTKTMKAEIDVHWVARGGGNPVKWIKRVAGRMPVVHFKDFAIVDNTPQFCEIGEGNLDWSGIIKACEETNVRWYSIEQDSSFGDKDIFESIKISFDNLKSMGVE
ncbi:MAG: sugar phosphate isomerase/epimerase [Kiritimatiellaeota bacterium]|nr:sugar phosphate isomerase/epimerase [Kiritimatiellota bacterium]